MTKAEKEVKEFTKAQEELDRFFETHREKIQEQPPIRYQAKPKDRQMALC